jgi:Ectoine synthase
MFVRTLDDLAPGKGVIRTPSWSSHRLLHRDDGMGVTLTDAVLEAGLDQVWWYKNHLEAVYCLEGEGVLEDLGTGKFFATSPMRPERFEILGPRPTRAAKPATRAQPDEAPGRRLLVNGLIWS